METVMRAAHEEIKPHLENLFQPDIDMMVYHLKNLA